MDRADQLDINLMTYTQHLRHILSRPHIEHSRRIVELVHQRAEDAGNSKGNDVPNNEFDNDGYRWHFDYVHNINFMLDDHVAVFTRAIEYMELNTSNCIICYSAMDMQSEIFVANIFMTCCTNCNMPICSNCVIAASLVSEQCLSCSMPIHTIHITYDLHAIVEKSSNDFKRLHQWNQNGAVFADDLPIDDDEYELDANEPDDNGPDANELDDNELDDNGPDEYANI